MNKSVVLNVGALIGVLVLMKWLGPKASLDAQIYYTGNEARDFLKGLSEGQSYAYFINELLDILFIFLYSFLAFFSVKRLFKTFAMAPWIALIPGVLDFVETTTILFILKLGDTLNLLDSLGVITFLKWGSGALLVILVGLKIADLRGWIKLEGKLFEGGGEGEAS